MKLESLAAIKRACRVGAKLEIVATDRPHLKPTMLEGRQRPIVKAQTNAIAVKGCHRHNGDDRFVYDPDVTGWLYWPKAGEIEPHGDDTFTYKDLATYRVIEA